jgi:16S rRNA (guanine966-N2)-methyltransferase
MPGTGQLRIIAGELKGRRIRVPAAAAATVRPTGDRVREALFSILGGRLAGGRALDAYAGSGALGFEALSRGIEEAEFVEADPATAATLRGSAEALGVLPRCRVHVGEVIPLLVRGALPGPFTLVLADPPWSEDVLPAFLTALAAGTRLTPGARIVLERDARGPAPAPYGSFSHVRTAVYGRTALDLFLAGGAP